PVPVVLALADSLALDLSPAARDSIESIGQGLDERLEPLRQELGERLRGVEGRQAIAALRDAQPLVQEGRGEIRAALEAVRAVMGDEAWGRLPERLRNLFAGAAGGRRRGG
ncbi:MAG: hypothetical protein D6701_03745, partial [Gemmatimonadetes bacterium]